MRLLVLFFLRRQRYRSKRWRWSIQWRNWSQRDQLRARISRISKLWTRRLRLSWIRSFKTPRQEEGQSRGKESPERGPVSTRKTDHLHDLRLLSCYWCSWYGSWLRWFVLHHSSKWQRSGIRYKMGREFIINDKDSIGWYSGKSDQLKTILELYGMEIHQKAGPDYHRSKTMVKKHVNWLKPIERKVWGLTQLKVRKLWRHPTHCFHLRNLIRSSVFRNPNPSNWRGSLLEGNKDHLLNQARSDLATQELHVESLNKCIGDHNDKRKRKDCCYRTHNTDLWNLDENKFDYKKNCLRRKKFSEILKPEICTKWEKIKSSWTTNGWGLSAEIKRKSRDNSAAHFPIATNARTDEYYEWFWRILGCWIKL